MVSWIKLSLTILLALKWEYRFDTNICVHFLMTIYTAWSKSHLIHIALPSALNLILTSLLTWASASTLPWYVPYIFILSVNEREQRIYSYAFVQPKTIAQSSIWRVYPLFEGEHDWEWEETEFVGNVFSIRLSVCRLWPDYPTLL